MNKLLFLVSSVAIVFLSALSTPAKAIEGANDRDLCEFYHSTSGFIFFSKVTTRDECNNMHVPPHDHYGDYVPYGMAPSHGHTHKQQDAHTHDSQISEHKSHSEMPKNEMATNHEHKSLDLKKLPIYTIQSTHKRRFGDDFE